MPQANQQKPAPKQSPRRTHAERTELSEQLMLDAALTLILEVGTASTTHKDIGERAGYSRGLANARFGSKDVLFKKLADRCRTLWIAEVQEKGKDKRGLDALLSRLDASASFAENHPDVAKAMYILWFESIGTSSEITKDLAAFHQLARDDIKHLYLEATFGQRTICSQEAEDYALQFTSCLFGLCYQWLVNPEAIDIRSSLSALKRTTEKDFRSL